jgi:hypothetical protein
MMLLEVLDLGNVKIGAACGIAPTLRTEAKSGAPTLLVASE